MRRFQYSSADEDLRSAPARHPAREGRNPSTGEPITIAAKPEAKVVKVRPLKKLKEMI
ncbi:MAG: HU family DNA-binding protein [Planctomycetaceae bacterium]